MKERDVANKYKRGVDNKKCAWLLNELEMQPCPDTTLSCAVCKVPEKVQAIDAAFKKINDSLGKTSH